MDVTGDLGAPKCCDSSGRGISLGRSLRPEDEDEVCARGREGEVGDDGP